MKEELKPSAELLAHTLASISLEDVENLKEVRLSDSDVINRANDAETFFNAHFEDKLKLMIQTQLEEIAKKATSDGQLQFGRGVIYGIGIVNEWFIKQKGIVASSRNKTNVTEFTEL